MIALITLIHETIEDRTDNRWLWWQGEWWLCRQRGWWPYNDSHPDAVDDVSVCVFCWACFSAIHLSINALTHHCNNPANPPNTPPDNRRKRRWRRKKDGDVIRMSWLVVVGVMATDDRQHCMIDSQNKNQSLPAKINVNSSSWKMGCSTCSNSAGVILFIFSTARVGVVGCGWVGVGGWVGVWGRI